MANQSRVIVIGAGVGGLTTAAALAKAGLDVTVLEAHVYAGGCAGTFYHQGYRFDAGATLAGGFYPGGPMNLVAQATGVAGWPAHPSDPAMTVHLPSGAAVPRWGDADKRRETYHAAFGLAGDRFWQWQEQTADLLWSLALKSPPWPPQSPWELAQLTTRGLRWLTENARSLRPGLALDAFRPVAAHLQHADTALRQFVDAQLLIAAQTTSSHTNALYGASALDLPRRGVVHLSGGIGAIAETLVAAVRSHGGNVRMRKTVTRIERKADGTYHLTTKRGEHYIADLLIANLPPWNIAALFDNTLPRRLQNLPPIPRVGWGAFMVYCGVDANRLPDSDVLHHQVILREPMGEGNTVFVSLSPGWDGKRAPAGRRAVTISTHTALGPWWQSYAKDKRLYEARKQAYQERMLAAAERALPGLSNAADVVLPGTPVTFQRFTRRQRGWVGGFPQTSLFRAWGPRLDHNLWMVGDSIFPGQSTAAVALGGLRVADAILRRGSPLTVARDDYAKLTSEVSGGD